MGRKRVNAVGRHIRLPKELDRWLAQRAKEEGASNPQPLIRRILTEHMRAVTRDGNPEQAAAA